MTSTENIYDISSKLIQHLDPHLILPILEFLNAKNIYDPKFLSKQKLAVLTKTKMVDSTLEEYVKVHGESAEYKASLLKQKDDIIQQLASLKEAIGTALAKTLTFEVIDSSVANTLCTPKQLTALFDYATLLQDIGSYAEALKAFTLYGICSSSEHEHYAKALWGRYHCALLTPPANAMDIVKAVRDHIDSQQFETLAVGVQNRSWFVTWLLFLASRSTPARTMFVEFLNSGYNVGFTSGGNPNERFLNAIISSAPHLFRYLIAFTVMSIRQNPAQQQSQNTPAYLIRRPNQLKELVRVLTNEQKNLNDPFVDFLLALYVDFDFNAAVKALNAIVPVIANDYFLNDQQLQADFFLSAKALLVDGYARLHTNITNASINAALPLNLPHIDNTITITDESNSAVTSASLSKQPFSKTLANKMRNLSKQQQQFHHTETDTR